MTTLNGWRLIVLLFGIAVLGSVLRCSLLTDVRTWRDALPSLYSIPIVIAGINRGVKAAVGVALASGLAQAVASAFCRDLWIRPFTETMLQLGVGVAAARLSQAQVSLAAARQGLPNEQGGETRENALQGVQSGRQIPGLSQIVAALVRRFRTPVSSIEGAVWLLEDRSQPEEKREEFVRIIQKESRTLDRALSDILEFTQPRKPKWQKVDLSQLVDQVIQRAGLKEPGPNFLVRKEMAPDLPLLACDPEQVGKMLLNLVMNSIQATPGGGQIMIAVRAGIDSAVITIKDHGRGISPAIAGRIFDPFFTTRENGLGLGLTVARQIADAHCGNIEIIESSDKGTSISLRLPLSHIDEQ